MFDRQTRLDSIDIFKFIGSYFVIAIHTNIFSSFSTGFNWMFVNIVARLAVYFYFVASAYLFFRGIEFCNGKITKSKENLQKLKKYVVRTTLLYAVWTLIYLIIDLPKWYSGGYLTVKQFIGYGISCVLNTSYYHLWFLISLIYAIPLLYFLLRFLSIKKVVVISVVVYLIGLLYGSYSFLFSMPGTSLWTMWGNCWVRLRTVVFNVIPICSLALLCDKVRVNKKVIAALSLGFAVLYLAEGFILYRVSESTASSYNIMLLPSVFFLFLSIKQIDLKVNNYRFFRKMSTLIYCMHPMMMALLGYIMDTSKLNSLVYFTVVFGIVTLMGTVLLSLYHRFSKLKWIKYLM